MGVVYAATNTRTRRTVALKVLRARVAEDQATRQRFLREARAASAVRHPNVVAIHDVLESEEGLPMMVMELLEGESLAARLAREKVIPLPEIAQLLLPVVSAVGTAHEVGIVHRDLKPDNIFLVRNGEGTDIRVLDFGIAKLTATEGDAAQSGAITGTGAVLGTPYYMSPEQIFGEKDIDHRADIWALGVILYECLAGVRPTQADNIGQIFKIVMTDAIRPIPERMPDLAPEVANLIGRMLSRDRSARPTDLRDVAAVLGAYASHARLPFGAPRPAQAHPDEAGREAGGATLALTPPRIERDEREPTLRSAEDAPGVADPNANTQEPFTISHARSGAARRIAPVVVVGVAALALSGGALALRDRTAPLALPAPPPRASAATTNRPPESDERAPAAVEPVLASSEATAHAADANDATAQRLKAKEIPPQPTVHAAAPAATALRPVKSPRSSAHTAASTSAAVPLPTAPAVSTASPPHPLDPASYQ